jgi:outer membrane protein
MRQRITGWARWCFLAGAALALGGCVGRNTIYEDIYHNRQQAFQAWRQARKAKEGGQDILTGKLGLDAAIVIAVGNDRQLGNNKALMASLQQRENAKGRITEAYSAAYPKLDLTSRYTRSGRSTVVSPHRSNYAVDLVLKQPIFRGGAIGAGIRAARVFSHLTDEQVAGTVQEVVYQARLGYYDILLADELAKVSEGELELAKEHRADVAKRQKAGLASRYDLLRATVEVSNIEAELIQRQNALRLARTRLFKTLGVSQESDVQLTTPLEYAEIKAEFEASVEVAFRERPEILQAELNVLIQRELLTTARAGWFPNIDLLFTHTRARPNPDNPINDHWGNASTAGVSLTWALFDGFATQGRVRQVEADLKRSAIELADAEETVLLDVRQAFLSLQDAEKLVASQKENLKRAEEGLELVSLGEREGLNTELEVLDARQALSQTQALYYQAVYQHMVARLTIDRSTGVLKNTGIGETLGENPPAP